MTRRYHALLVAALPVPFGRTVMLDLLVETLHRPDGQSMHLGAPQIAASQRDTDYGNLTEFRLEQGLPVWRFEADGLTVERRAVLLHRQNTLVLNWHLVEGENSGTLHIRPFVHFRCMTRVSVRIPAAFTRSPRSAANITKSARVEACRPCVC